MDSLSRRGHTSFEGVSYPGDDSDDSDDDSDDDGDVRLFDSDGDVDRGTALPASEFGDPCCCLLGRQRHWQRLWQFSLFR